MCVCVWGGVFVGVGVCVGAWVDVQLTSSTHDSAKGMEDGSIL